MIRLGMLLIPLTWLSGPAFAADLGPYSERETYLPPPPPARVERKIVEHHYYYHQEPTIYRERRVYVEPRLYDAPTVYKERFYPRHAYAYGVWQPRYFFPRQRFWAHRHHHWW